MRKCLFSCHWLVCLVLEFVGSVWVCVSLLQIARVTDRKAGSSVCEASSCVFFCEGERGLSWPLARRYLTLYVCHYNGLLM